MTTQQPIPLLEGVTPGPDLPQQARQFLAAEYEMLRTDYGRRKAVAIRQGDQSGFVRTDIALFAVFTALAQASEPSNV